MALTPRLLRRGLQLFAVISLAGVGVVLWVYGDNLAGVVRSLLHLHWGWVAIGLVLSSMDWFGGGTRLWVVARQVHPGVRWRDMVLAGGMSAWGGYLTPFQTGAGPMMIWTMRRGGVRLPEAMTSTFMTFVATVAFFAIAGPLAIYFGAGKSLAQHNVVLGISYYDLFRTSLTIFGILGVLMLVAMVFPLWLRNGVHWLATRWSLAAAACGAHRNAARGNRPGARMPGGVRQSPGMALAFWASFCQAPPTPTNCSPATPRCARSASKQTSSISCCFKHSSPSFSISRRRRVPRGSPNSCRRP